MQYKLGVISNNIATIDLDEGKLCGFEIRPYNSSEITSSEVIDYSAGLDLCLLDLGEYLLDRSILEQVSGVIEEVPILAMIEGESCINSQILALIQCFSHGKLDVVCKPCSSDELVNKIHECLRRQLLLRKPEFEIHLDEDAHSASVDGQSMLLTRMEYKILQCLLSPRGKICSRDLLLTNLHHDDFGITDRSIDQHVKNLRKKFSDLGLNGTNIISSVYGVGYQIKS